MKMTWGKQDLIVETGKVARQANGSVTLQYGGTVVLVTACMSKEPKEGQSYFPLIVEYQEKTYAAGRIPGGFFKREGRPSESEILTARLIDRPIRPLFPDGFLNDVQIMAIVLSSDGENDPDILAVNGASFALSLSDIPFQGPLACCRVGRVNGEFILNPTYAQLEQSELDVIIAENDTGVVMLEARAKEIPEALFSEAVEFGCAQLKPIRAMQRQMQKTDGKPKAAVTYKTPAPALIEKISALALNRLEEIYLLTSKDGREDAVDALSKQIRQQLIAEGFSDADVKAGLYEVEKKQVRKKLLEDGKRVDGRSFTEIRPISCAVSALPRTHGSSIFTRGQTQSLAVTTLGTGDDEQLIEALEGEKYKTFMLHYSFPPFSVGEVGPVRGPGRREIGHGALAERALLAVIPPKERFPYTVRVVSEILESNGSSSMATVCAATLSLMDAGVPIKDPVGGVALGLVKEGTRSIVLTDIAGVEDHFGDMDFKVAGTKAGITAVQMDLKIDGITTELMRQCLTQSREARLFVLDKMREAIEKPRADLSAYAPRIEIIKVNPDKIGTVIGPGGKTIKKIVAATGATINIEDDGSVFIASNDPAKSAEAIKMVRALTDEVEVNKIYTGKVKRIVPFGAFCEIAPGKEGLVHISEFSSQFVKDIDSVAKMGDEFPVKVIGIDELGRINLSKKQADPSNAK